MSFSNYLLRDLQWDTKYFGVKCGRLDINMKLSVQDKAEIIKKVNGYTFLTIKNAKNNFMENRFISNEIKGYLTDINVQLEKKYIKESNEYKKVELSNKYEYDANIIKIAGEVFIKSRFLNDQNITKEQANGIYTNWVINSFNKLDKYFVTKKLDNKVIGFILFYVNQNNQSVIELIGVDQYYRGLGIGKELMSKLDEFCIYHNIKTGVVGTQIENIDAINFYNKCGYKMKDVNYIYHKWL